MIPVLLNDDLDGFALLYSRLIKVTEVVDTQELSENIKLFYGFRRSM